MQIWDYYENGIALVDLLKKFNSWRLRNFKLNHQSLVPNKIGILITKLDGKALGKKHNNFRWYYFFNYRYIEEAKPK